MNWHLSSTLILPCDESQWWLWPCLSGLLTKRTPSGNFAKYDLSSLLHCFIEIGDHRDLQIYSIVTTFSLRAGID